MKIFDSDFIENALSSDESYRRAVLQLLVAIHESLDSESKAVSELSWKSKVESGVNFKQGLNEDSSTTQRFDAAKYLVETF